MSITQGYYSSISCDMCGDGYDEIDYHPKDMMEILLKYGWTGTYRKCFCPKCSEEMIKKAVPNEFD